MDRSPLGKTTIENMPAEMIYNNEHRHARKPWAVFIIIVVIILFGLFWWHEQKKISVPEIPPMPAQAIREERQPTIDELQSVLVNTAIPDNSGAF
jgi:cytoskeletal protein RodZ